MPPLLEADAVERVYRMGDDVEVRLIKNGDRRLSADRDLAILTATVDALLGR